MGMMPGVGEVQSLRVLQALEVLKKAASQVHQQAAEGQEEDDGGCNVRSSPSMRALLELERQSEGLLGHDPDLEPLSRLLSQLRASAACSARPRKPSSSFLPASLITSLFRLHADMGQGSGEEIARVAAGIEEEIQAWIDRENTHRIAAAVRYLLRKPRPTPTPGEKDGGNDHHGLDDEAAVACLLSDMESRLSHHGFDARYQSALLRSGAFPCLLDALTSSASKLVRESCASAVSAAVRFNPAVFVGPVLSSSSSVARSLAAMATPNSARALGALVSAIRTPLVDEMDARGEIQSVVGLLRKPIELAAAAMGALMEMAAHGRREAVQAMVEAGAVERFMKLELEYGVDEEQQDRDKWNKKKLGVGAGEVSHRINSSSERDMEVAPVSRLMQGCVARLVLQVETGRGMGRRDKRELRAEIIRRLRAAAEEDDPRAGNILAEVLWDIT